MNENSRLQGEASQNLSGSQKVTWKFLPFLFFFVLVYLVRLHSQSIYQIPADRPMKIAGRISGQPYLKGSQQVITVGLVTIKTERFPGYFYGQKITVFGSFKKRVINPFKTDYVADYPAIRVVEENQNPNGFIYLRQRLFLIRGRLEREIGSLLNEPQASLLNGILLGVKKQMPTGFWQQLQKTGTLHIVVASGFNLTIVAGGLISALTLVINRKKALIFALIGIIFYALMVGAEPPVIRAAIMAAISFASQALGRQQDGLVALVFSAVIMLLISPLILFDLGFQLSFAAMAGIILIEPLLVNWGKVFRWRGIGPVLSSTIAAQIGVAPLLLVNFGQASLISPIINTLIVPVVPLIMNLGLITAVGGLIFMPLAKVLAWFCWLPLTYAVGLIEFFGRPGWINLQIGKISWWWVIGYYLLLILIMIKYTNRLRSLPIDQAKINK